MARQARARAIGAGEVCAGARAGRDRLPRLRLGREGRRDGGDDPGDLRLPALSAPYDGRALPVAGRPVGDEPARALLSRVRSEEHTSELQSLMSTSYDVFFLKKQNK